MQLRLGCLALVSLSALAALCSPPEFAPAPAPPLPPYTHPSLPATPGLRAALGLDPRWTPQQAQGEGQETVATPPPDPPANTGDHDAGTARPKRQRAAVKRLGQEADTGGHGRGGGGSAGGRKKRQGGGSGRLPLAPSLTSSRSGGDPCTPPQDADCARAMPAPGAAAIEAAQGGWHTASLPVPLPQAPPNWEQCTRLMSDSARSLPLPRQLSGSTRSLPLPCRLSDAARSLPLPPQSVGPGGSALPPLATFQGLDNVQYVHVVLPLSAASQLMGGNAPQQDVPQRQPGAGPPAGAPSPQECLERYWQEQQMLEQRRGQYQQYQRCGERGSQGGPSAPPQPGQQPPPGPQHAQQLSSELRAGASWQVCRPSLPAVCMPFQLRAEQSMPPLLRAEQSMPPLLRAEQSMPPLLRAEHSMPPLLRAEHSMPPLRAEQSMPLSMHRTLPPPASGLRGAHSLQPVAPWARHQQLTDPAEQMPLAPKPQHWQQWQSVPLQPPPQLPPSSFSAGGAHSQLQEFAASCSLPPGGPGSLTPSTPLPDQHQHGCPPLHAARLPAQEAPQAALAQQAPLQQLLQPAPQLSAQTLWQPSSLLGLAAQQHLEAKQHGQPELVLSWQQQVGQAQQVQRAQQALLDIERGFTDDLEALCSACEPGITAFPPEVPVPSA